MVKRKRLGRYAKWKKVKELLELGYTNKEILKEIAVGEATIGKIRAELLRERQKAQESLELKTKKEEEQASLVARYDEVLPVATKLMDRVEEAGEKVDGFEAKFDKFMNKEVEVRIKALDIVENSLGEIDPEKLAYIMLKDGK